MSKSYLFTNSKGAFLSLWLASSWPWVLGPETLIGECMNAGIAPQGGVGAYLRRINFLQNTEINNYPAFGQELWAEASASSQPITQSNKLCQTLTDLALNSNSDGLSAHRDWNVCSRHVSRWNTQAVIQYYFPNRCFG